MREDLRVRAPDQELPREGGPFCAVPFVLDRVPDTSLETPQQLPGVLGLAFRAADDAEHLGAAVAIAHVDVGKFLVHSWDSLQKITVIPCCV